MSTTSWWTATYCALGDLRYPIAPGTGSGTGREVHDRQHYRLIGWRSGVCGYRRFFSITSLAGLRQEDRAVFDATHVEVKRWFDEGLVDGLRIDHPDGLSDPAGYLRWLREITGPHAWIVIEKILAVDEPLDPSLPVAGTTGYDALREIGGLFIDPAGAGPLTDLVDSTGFAVRRNAGAGADTQGPRRHRHPRERAGPALPGDRRRVRPDPSGSWRRSRRPTQSDPRVPLGLSEPVVGAAHRAGRNRRRAADLAEPLAIVATAVGDGGEAAVRLQQLCGAATAKSMEDCLFYRDARLVSLNEVGGEPDRFGVSLAEFHQRAQVRADMWPQP